MEYPLFTQAACDKCPSARYVGGTSRWLCECSEPTVCAGVVYAVKRTAMCDKLRASGINYSHLEYMDGLISHHDYHAQFVTPSSVDQLVHRIGKHVLAAAKDPHLNDIPLRNWDAIGRSCNHRFDLLSISNGLSNSGLTNTLSAPDAVCVNKAAAKIWIAANVPHKPHNVRVEYRDNMILDGNRLRHFEAMMFGNIISINEYYRNTSNWYETPQNISFLGAYILD